MKDSLVQIWHWSAQDQIPLLDLQFFGTTLWSWIILFLFLGLGGILQKILRAKLSQLQNQIQPRKNFYISFLLHEPLSSPLAWIFVCAFWRLILEASSLNERVERVLSIFLLLIFAVQVVFLLLRAVDAFGRWLEFHSVQEGGRSLNQQLAPLATKTLKVALIALGVLLTLENLGIQVGSLLAGIGIGSLALALAAQDTVANLFGSVMIIADRPFQVGDLVRVMDTEGVIEEVGFRSTRIRTASNSLVSIPNSVMAKERIDNLGARKIRRVQHTLGFEYSTQEAHLKEWMERMRYFLSQHPRVSKELTQIAFVGLGDSSWQVRVVFYTNSPAPEHELEAQQDFLFEAVRLASETGLSYAFPTQTLYTRSLK